MNKKDNIIRAATILFAEKGFKETSMAEVSKLSGAAEGTIFYHFKTKDDILISILKTVKDGIIGEFKSYFFEKKFSTGMEMMEGIMSFYLYIASKHEEWFLLLHRHYPYELAKMNSECRGHLEAIYNCLVDLFEEAIIRGQKDRTITNSSSRKTALIIFSMVNGLIWFKIHNLYDAAALYNELMACTQKILNPP